MEAERCAQTFHGHPHCGGQQGGLRMARRFAPVDVLMTRRLMFVLLCLGLWPGLLAGRVQAKVTDVHVEKSRNNVVLFIRGNETLQYKLSEFENPNRLLVTVFEQDMASDRESIRVGQGQVDKVFVKQEGQHVRVSVNLLARTQYNVYTKDGNRTIVLSLRTDDFEIDAAPGQQESAGAAPTGDGAPSSGGVPVKGGQQGSGASSGSSGSNFPPPGFAYRDYKGEAPPPLPGYGFDNVGASAGEGGAAGQFDVFGKRIDSSPLLEHIVFQDAEISEVALQLSRLTNTNILVDSLLVGATAGSTASPESGVEAGTGGVSLDLKNVTLEQALDFITKASGWAWVKIANTYMILASETKFAGFSDESTWGKTNADTTLPVDVRYIPLRYASVAMLAPYVNAVFGLGAGGEEAADWPNVAYDAARNIIILRGALHELDKAEAVIKKLDTPGFDNNIIFKIIPIPKDLVKIDQASFNELINALMASPYLGYDGKHTTDTYVDTNAVSYQLQFLSNASQLIFLGNPEAYQKVKAVIDQFFANHETWRMHPFKLINIPVSALNFKDFASVLKYDLTKGGQNNYEMDIRRNGTLFLDTGNNVVFFFGTKEDADRLKIVLERVDTAEAKVVSVKVKLKNLQTNLIAPTTMEGSTVVNPTEQLEDCQHPLDCQLQNPYYGYPAYGGNVMQPPPDDDDRKMFYRNPVGIQFHHAINTISIIGPQLFAHRIRDFFLEADAENKVEQVEDTVRLKYMLPSDVGQYITLMMSKGVGCGAPLGGNQSRVETKTPTVPTPPLAGAATTPLNLNSGFVQVVAGELARDAYDGACLLWVADEQKGTFYLKGPPNAVRLAKNVVRAYDTPVPMVKLDVKVLEVRSSDVDELGGKGTQRLGDILLGADGATGLVTSILDEVTDLASGAIRNGDGSLELKFRNSKAKARVLANPSILTSHMKVTNFDFTDAVGYQQATGTSNDVAVEELGITLAVTPYIHDQNEVTLEVNPDIRTLGGFFEGQSCALVQGSGGASGTSQCLPTRRPLISTRNLTTKVRVTNNVPLIIGGLISSRDTENVSKIPILGDLPLFGSFFRNASKSKEDLEVVIVITPTILMGENLSSTPTDETAQ